MRVKTALILGLVLLVMGCKVEPAPIQVFVCDSCGNGYYSLEDAQACHGTTVHIERWWR